MLSYRGSANAASDNLGFSRLPRWKRNDRYVWIGVNSSRIEEGGGQNLGFAIARKELKKRKMAYHEANVAGARKLIFGQ